VNAPPRQQRGPRVEAPRHASSRRGPRRGPHAPRRIRRRPEPRCARHTLIPRASSRWVRASSCAAHVASALPLVPQRHAHRSPSLAGAALRRHRSRTTHQGQANAQLAGNAYPQGTGCCSIRWDSAAGGCAAAGLCPSAVQLVLTGLVRREGGSYRQ
jgi:hypothetical protein